MLPKSNHKYVCRNRIRHIAVLIASLGSDNLILIVMRCEMGCRWKKYPGWVSFSQDHAF